MALDCALILILAAALVWPLFQAGYLRNWGSIESTFIADARFLAEHWPHPRWQPLWYCGTRFDYIYPPALRYGAAGIALLLSLRPVEAYHTYAALLFCMGIAAVYLLARVGSGSRAVGWFSAVAAALLSPTFLFLRSFREDSPWMVPPRLWVLVQYGEGPHIASLAWLPLALVLAWIGLRRGRPLALAGAAVAAALVVSHNFYGATALAMLYPVLVWSLWVTLRERRVWLRAALVAGLAYGLTAFWLVPSYVEVTLRNMRLVAQPGNAPSVALLAAASVLFALATNRWARGKAELAWPVFLAGGAALFALTVLGRFAFNFRVMGEPHRLVPELDMLLIVSALEVMRRWWNRPPGLRRLAARTAISAVTVLSFATAGGFLRHAWELYPPERDYEQRVEYRMQQWMARHMPEARALVCGSVRFWYNAWNNLAQVGGGSEQGISHAYLPMAQWEIIQGTDPETAAAWLASLGADAVIVHDRQSQEIYHDFPDPKKFAGALEVLYDDGEGNTIYRVPRRFPAPARVVDRKQVEALRSPRSGDDLAALQAYLAAVEQGPAAPAAIAWHGSDAFSVRAKLEPGQAVLVQVTHDAAWRAYAAGRRLAIRRDPLDFMLVEAPPGEQEIRMVFELPLENIAGRALSTLSALAVLGMALWDVRKRRAASTARTRSPGRAAAPTTS